MSVTVLFLAPAVEASTLTGDRVVATAAAVVALVGVIAGGFALARSAGRRAGRARVGAIAAGLTGLLAGWVVVATADGGPGTGNGIVGGYAAVVLGLTAVLLGGLALTRTRRAT